MKYNKGFDFWNEDHRDCNCGSYAFNLDEWYHPGSLCGEDEEENIIENLEYWAEDEHEDDELADKLADFYLDRIANDFKDDITISIIEPDLDNLEDGIEVIAFRAGAYQWKGEYADFDYDFHFKVYRYNNWFEKRGCEPVRITSLNDWSGSIYYNSQTFYITHHLKI